MVEGYIFCVYYVLEVFDFFGFWVESFGCYGMNFCLWFVVVSVVGVLVVFLLDGLIDMEERFFFVGFFGLIFFYEFF